MRADSREYIGVTVEASVPLGTQVILIGLEDQDGTRTEYEATWVGTSVSFTKRLPNGTTTLYYRRDARILVGPGGDPSVAVLTAGRYEVTAKVTDSPEAPVMDVFTLYVTEA